MVSRDPLLLAVIALSGMVAVNANETAGLQSVDQALIPQSVADDQRTAAFALYNLVASIASALGALCVGALPFLGSALGLGAADIYAPAFLAYALLGLLSLFLTARLDARAETGERLEKRLAIGRSRPIVAQLSLLFGLDSFASSLTVQSYLAFFLAQRFGADPQTAGALFFVAGLLTAISFPIAAWLASRIGLISTMVFTHIPSSIFLIGMAFSPNLALAAFFLLGRAALASMDIPARQSYLMAVVDLGVPLVATGLLKIVYDVALFALFRSRPAPEEVLARTNARAGGEAGPRSGGG
jgi:predicted MFS family arabinose efflux permease